MVFWARFGTTKLTTAKLGFTSPVPLLRMRQVDKILRLTCIGGVFYLTVVYLIYRLARFRSPVWDFLFGYSDEAAFIHDCMAGHCCSDGGSSNKIKTELLSRSDDHEESVKRLLEVMRAARICYQQKGVPLNTDYIIFEVGR